MDEDGVLLEDVDAASTDGKVIVHIPKGTKILDPEGGILDEIGVTPIGRPPTPPEGYYVIAAFDFKPDGATFDPGIEITLAYDPEMLPEGVDEANLAIAFLDGATGEWVFVTGGVDPVADTVTFSIAHFTAFAILAAAPPAPTPTPSPIPSPSLTPAPPGGGLTPGTWAGIGIGILLVLGLGIWLLMRRR